MTALSALLDGALEQADIRFGSDPATHTAGALAATGAMRFGLGPASGAVGAILTNDRQTVELVLGAIMVGARIVSLPLPGRGADPSEYLAFLRDICQQQNLEVIVARDDLAALMQSNRLPSISHTDLATSVVGAPTGHGFELVQFSSGSTADPKAVRLDDITIGANVSAIMDVVGPRQKDTTVSWLPLSHDMGLLGMLLTTVASAAPERGGKTSMVLLTPESFLRNPAIWMATMDRYGGTFTAAPDFGFRMATRHSTAGPDLSAVRCAIVGGEIVRRSTLDEFEEAFAPSGWSPLAFSPAYGMAEVGLAVTLTRPDERRRHLMVNTEQLAEQRIAPTTHGGTAIVASGTPLPGYKVELDSDEVDVAPIHVAGPSIGLDGNTGAKLVGHDGRYGTGDVGFVVDRRLYVCGRGDDYLIVHGRKVYGPAIEEAIGTVPGVRRGRAVVVGLPSGDWIACVETDGTTDRVSLGRLRSTVQRAATQASAASPAEVVVVRTGTLPMTPSGKAQRHQLRNNWLRGALARL